MPFFHNNALSPLSTEKYTKVIRIFYKKQKVQVACCISGILFVLNSADDNLEAIKKFDRRSRNLIGNYLSDLQICEESIFFS